MLLDKTNALYVKCCIIANGITDSQGDCVQAEDIKKIFTTFDNQANFEILHDEIPLKEVSLLENYISTADETIGTSIVPSGSWMAVIRVDNPDIKASLMSGKFKGVSLNNRIADKCKANLHGHIRYQDIADVECVIPIYISFVEGGANGYGLHVMDYPAYIQKSDDVKINNSNGGFKLEFKEFIEGLKSLIKQAEDTPEEEPVVEKEDTAQKEQTEETAETEEEVEAVEEEPAVKKEDKEPEQPADETEEKEEPAIEKADETVEEEVKETETKTESDLEARVAKIEEAIAKLTAEEEETEEETPDDDNEPEDEDTPKITKSEKVIETNVKTPSQSNYYSITGRDPLTGKKLKQ